MGLTWPDVEMVDISGLIESIQADAGELDEALCRIDATAKDIAISGTWEPYSEEVARLAVRVTLSGVERLPRRTKKALKKYWRGDFVSPREHCRVRTVLGNRKD